jgi:ataxia telangiectasia mutated family protein
VQQIFVLTSKLLAKINPLLAIRNYKVIPITSTIGLIEFIENAISIQDYLLKAYKKYREIKKKKSGSKN